MKNCRAKLLGLFMALGLMYMAYKGYLYRKEIEENKVETVCRFIYCKQSAKTTKSLFEYYVDTTRYANYYGDCPEDYEKEMNGFFVLDYSSKDPNKIKVSLSKPITDTVLILKAGFTEKDLKTAE